MEIDTLSMMTVAMANLLGISVVLPLIMGRSLTPAARAMQAGLLLLTLGWAMLTASEYANSFVLSVLSMGSLSASLVMLHRALGGWLGPRPGERAIVVLAVLVPVGYALTFSSYAVRVGWSNFLLAAMLVLLARATLLARRNAGRHWRLVLLACFASMAVLTAARGLLGAFFTSFYPTFLAPNPVNIAAALATNIAVVLGTVALLVAWRDEADHRLRTIANTDSLTGLPNRRGFTERAEALFANAKRYHHPLTVLMLDLDHFKQVNDRHGHDGGDKALVLFAEMLGETRRTGDLVGRLGGEEFCVLLPNAKLHTASGFDQRLRARLQQQVKAKLGFALDYSAGVAALSTQDTTLAGLMARADAALYQAKREGRAKLLMGQSGAGDTVV
ncbi:GGDEF domain-containing protein [Pseudorhodoferax sp. Leaf267]|uniref:GGDEF domain-containing protein n=1 Tax=Pseudorhodoferax sp. Leaf267 TaxID=1736316 RepID=UPI0007007B7A|nr:GGDEF domain-containing protein [Pseudorhodoferax sp. Leaf267]KQP12701.1 diguanylate cyclase [Pseudorhodoferax sp. Leaf267]